MADSDRSSAMKDRCPLCERKTTDDRVYCSYHGQAYAKVKLAFNKWREAYENMSWERYLERILELEETGDWARQVARHQLGHVRSTLR